MERGKIQCDSAIMMQFCGRGTSVVALQDIHSLAQWSCQFTLLPMRRGEECANASLLGGEGLEGLSLFCFECGQRRKGRREPGRLL